MAGKLIIVGTPIGNLADMSPRALEALEQADCVCAEDTRVTGRLLKHFGIEARLERCDDNVIARRVSALVERMAAGECIAFCSDAGMPGVSDPGMALVDAARREGIVVEVVPGPTALATAVAAAGFPTTSFFFGGFLPRKSAGRRQLLESLATLDALLVFYESPHRAASAAADIAAVFPQRRAALCRELTKLHEEVLRLPAADLACELEARGELKGEVVFVVEGPAKGEGAVLSDAELVERAKELLAAGSSKSAVAKQLAQASGRSRSDVYDLVLSIS